MTPEQALYLLTHPEEWPHGDQLPVARRGGNVIWNQEDAGIVLFDDLCRVWTKVYIGEGNPRNGIAIEYNSPEHLLSEWAID